MRPFPAAPRRPRTETLAKTTGLRHSSCPQAARRPPAARSPPPARPDGVRACHGLLGWSAPRLFGAVERRSRSAVAPRHGRRGLCRAECAVLCCATAELHERHTGCRTAPTPPPPPPALPNLPRTTSTPPPSSPGAADWARAPPQAGPSHRAPSAARLHRTPPPRRPARGPARRRPGRPPVPRVRRRRRGAGAGRALHAATGSARLRVVRLLTAAVRRPGLDGVGALRLDRPGALPVGTPSSACSSPPVLAITAGVVLVAVGLLRLGLGRAVPQRADRHGVRRRPGRPHRHRRGPGPRRPHRPQRRHHGAGRGARARRRRTSTGSPSSSGVGSLVVLFVGSRLAPRVPWSLLVLVGGITLSDQLDLAGPRRRGRRGRCRPASRSRPSPSSTSPCGAASSPAVWRSPPSASPRVWPRCAPSPPAARSTRTPTTRSSSPTAPPTSRPASSAGWASAGPCRRPPPTRGPAPTRR